MSEERLLEQITRSLEAIETNFRMYTDLLTATVEHIEALLEAK